ncbi:MAG: type III-B CRISPR module RAMP protein Cmr4 [Treponema sp.]|jgi:CRISPR-associated protein Cmr4|nr:type III-B CRISPR module RAMP protein Cmr4 [Treponema sp.]
MDLHDISVLVMYAVTPCHAGSGSALGTVDLPIQRERHTNWPLIQSSGMKGAFRANFDRYKDTKLEEKDREQFKSLSDTIFGDTNAAGSAYAGAISISDAKILAFPMRSNVAPFVWISCPAVLRRLNRDLALAGKNIAPAGIDAIAALVTDNKEDNKALCINGGLAGRVLLEDYEVEIVPGDTVFLKPLSDYFCAAERLLLVSDEIFNYGVSDCTQINAQISIDPEKGTTKDGSLRYQEELPADTLMYSIIHWGDTRSGEELKAGTIRSFIKDKVISTHIQAGGDETLGRGIFELEWK